MEPDSGRPDSHLDQGVRFSSMMTGMSWRGHRVGTVIWTSSRLLIILFKMVCNSLTLISMS